MPTTIHLQSQFAYGILPLWILFFILISPLVIKKINKRRRKRKLAEKGVNDQPVIKAVPLSVKERYVEQLELILDDHRSGRRDTKDCYQLLSYFLREFFKEYAGVDVTRKTLAEIRGVNGKRSKKLIALIEEFYACEFSPDVTGDVESAIKNTIREINNW